MLLPFAKHIHAANQALLVEHDLDEVGVFFAADYVAHLTAQDARGGHEMIRGFLGLYHTAFPKLELKVDILVEGKDRVAWQRTLRAKHDGPFKGFPASGLEIVWRDVVTSRFDKAGRIVEEWIITDLAEQLLMSRKRGGLKRESSPLRKPRKSA